MFLPPPHAKLQKSQFVNKICAFWNLSMPFSFSQSIAYAKESISIKWSRIINLQLANQSKVRNCKSEKTLLGGVGLTNFQFLSQVWMVLRKAGNVGTYTDKTRGDWPLFKKCVNKRKCPLKSVISSWYTSGASGHKAITQLFWLFKYLKSKSREDQSLHSNQWLEGFSKSCLLSPPHSNSKISRVLDHNFPFFS